MPPPPPFMSIGETAVPCAETLPMSAPAIQSPHPIATTVRTKFPKSVLTI